MINKTRQDAYRQALTLQRKGLGWRRIYKKLKEHGYNVPAGTISNWLYKKCYPTYKELKGNYNELTTQKAFVLGVIGPGDGFVSQNRIGLSVIDEDFALKFKKSVEKTYGFECKKYLQKVSGYGKLPRHKIILYSKEVLKDLNSYDVSLKEKDRCIPKAIKKSNPSIKAKYIQGFSDSQGSVGQRNIDLASKNKEGLEEIQDMLLELNIRSSLQVNKGGSRLSIQDRKSLENFNSTIGFYIRRKQKKLTKMLKRYKFYGTPTTTVDKLMPEIIKLNGKGYKQIIIAKMLGLNQSTISRRLRRL